MRGGDESLERLRAAIDELADAEAAELLAEARAEARARVRSILSDALVRSMLDRVHEQLARPPAREPSEPARPERQGIALAWYVYGVVAADRTVPPLAGVDPAHRVTTLREGALAAVASHVLLEDFDEARLREHLADMGWVEATARAHEHVLEQIRERATVIPMRMCTVFHSEESVHDMLRREAGALEEALSHLAGKTEMGVKVFADPKRRATPAGAADVSGEDAPGEGSEGTAYMDQRRRELEQADADDRVIDEACAQIHERLCAVAADGLIAPLQRPEATGRRVDMVLSGVYLVEDDALDTFSAEVDQLQDAFAALGLELELTGPWPAYNFVPDTIGAAW